MTKFVAGVTFALGIALGCVGASASIFVGPGVGTPCAQGNCPLFSGSVNAIGSSSLDLFQSSTNANVDVNSLLLIFAVPNNPANALPANPVTGAQLYTPATSSSSTPVTVGGLSPETLFTHGDVYGTGLGLLDGDSISFTQLQSADYGLFPSTYNSTTNPIANFSLYEINLSTGASTPFGPNDLINVDFTSLPVGTFALGYGTPSLSVTDTPFAQAGVSGVVAAVAEPTSLALFGTALASFGYRAFRRRTRTAGS